MADNERPDDQLELQKTVSYSFENYIVGIGASAGGLEAIMEFFDHMPKVTGCSFIIVQHLSPDYKSLMPELLQKHTGMQVYEAEDKMLVKSDCIYLIPHKKNMTIAFGKLHLTDKDKSQNIGMTIDIFFYSLANYKKEKAIGVVLSGTGTDGSRGLEAIKKAGGMTMAQDPLTAKFDGMPMSAINTGLVDLILSPELMPEEILDYINDMPEERLSVPFSPSDDKEITEILSLLKERTAFDFTSYKRPTITRRIQRRMTYLKIADYTLYKKYLLDNPDELVILHKEFLIGVTKFFRDAMAFDCLSKKVIPEIVKNKKETEPLKVWVAGCSTGEEAYSIAILIMEQLVQLNKDIEVKIFATDIDQDAIDFASKGCYSISAVADVSQQRLNTYFERSGKEYRLLPNIRKMVIFAPHDLVKDPPFSRMDLVSCRNLLIYLNPDLQKHILKKFHFSLNLEGFLFLGSSESNRTLEEVTEEVDRKWKVYKKIGAALPATSNNLYQGKPVFKEPFKTLAPKDPHALTTNYLNELMNDSLLSISGFSVLIINEKNELVQASGNFKEFLTIPDKNFTLNIMKMMPEELSIAAAALMRKSSKEAERVSMEGIRVKVQEEVKIVDMFGEMIKPDKKTSKKIFLILLRARKNESAQPEKQEETTELSYEHVHHLEAELNETKENLQSAIEELETANEEMQSSNEELISANEELQSTNEELQSLNEELHTVNAEHQQKIKELIELNDDLNNYFKSTDIGQVFLDKNLIIRKFTPAITNQINLISNDIGRPISHISSNINYSNFMDDIRSVIQSAILIEKEVQANNGKWYLMKMMPYVKLDKSSGGVVIAFVDIDKIKNLNTLLSSVLESSFNGIMVFKSLRDEKNSIVDFEWMISNKVSNHILGKPFHTFAGKRMLQEIPKLGDEGLFEKYVQVVESNNPLHTEFYFNDDEKKVWLEIAAVKLGDGFTFTFADITEKRIAQQKIRDAYNSLKEAQENLKRLNNELEERVTERTKELSLSEERFRLLSIATNDAVYDWDFASNAIWWSEGFNKLFGYSADESDGTIESWFSKIHPEDRERVKQGIQEIINDGQKLWSDEYRLLKAQGSYAHILDRGYVLRYDDGMPYRMIGSMVDLSSLKEAQNELKRTNENLLKINSDLDNFIYTASHDLRAPISNIEGLIITLKDIINLEDQEVSSIIEMINLSINRFKETIHDLTEIAKTQKEGVEDMEELNLIEMIEEVRFSIEDMFNKSDAKIVYDIKEPVLKFSRKNLRSIIYNLLSNAIKYKSPDRAPIIQISSDRTSENCILLQVEDNGLGIDRNKQNKIFTMFKRFHDHVEGTGIGLYIVKRMVTNSGGSIEVDSELGKGTVFKIYFKNPQ